ncbi:MAG TPA: LON peptidase substrate-binding domain-containing protein [Vicinamibacterales bacterium]|nr:LON peptidase substrate-binding domain-containing protein [Vicinamibacterales bacterium]
MLPFALPIFPLPTVVLFPNVFLPLHIFEPRYRQMVAESLAGDRIIGMVLLQPGYEDEYEGEPPIYTTGCSGLITHVENLEDGKYNLVLRGLEKFTIHNEEAAMPGRLYRSAVISPLEDAMRAGDRDELRHERKKLQQLLQPLFNEGISSYLPDAMPDEDLINALAQYLEFEPVEKLALLERPGALARCRAMVELLEMKEMGSGVRDQGSGLIH